MATANPPEDYGQSARDDTAADRVFATFAMVGAGLGSLASVSVAGGLLGGYAPTVFGTLGVIAGSATTAFVGRYLLFPAWAAMARAIPRRNV